MAALLDNDGSESQSRRGAVGLRAATTWMVPVNGGQNATWDTGSGVEVSGDCPAMAGQSCDLGSRVYCRTVAALVPYLVWY